MICLNPCGNHIIVTVKLIKQIDLSIKNRSFGVLIILFLIFYIVRSTKRVIIIQNNSGQNTTSLIYLQMISLQQLSLNYIVNK